MTGVSGDWVAVARIALPLGTGFLVFVEVERLSSSEVWSCEAVVGSSPTSPAVAGCCVSSLTPAPVAADGHDGGEADGDFVSSAVWRAGRSWAVDTGEETAWPLLVLESAISVTAS